MMHTCGCCGTGFSTEKQNPDHDTGFGTCQRCQKMDDKRNEQHWLGLEQKVAAALSEKNRTKFWDYNLALRRGLILEMMDDGLITWRIEAREPVRII